MTAAALAGAAVAGAAGTAGGEAPAGAIDGDEGSALAGEFFGEEVAACICGSRMSSDTLAAWRLSAARSRSMAGIRP